MKNLIITILVFVSLLLSAQNISPKRELRGAWVATVANIDWPSQNNFTPGKQIFELIDLFDKLEAAGINAIFFQIRTECDALYNSNYEPWSFYLTGEQGKAPEPFFDPLEFAISEAQSRAIELHAWFNPYRALRSKDRYVPSEEHVTNTHPEWILDFGDYHMIDPGIPGVQTHVLNVVNDVISNYDIDGIHFDDYFYPYTPITNEDSLTFTNYDRGITDIGDWRRDNINSLMGEIYELINETKPWIKFGISPFGIVENHYADTDGFNSYRILYCDPLNWLQNRIVDYVNPQLYWSIEHEKAPYKKLLPWWASVTNGRHLYIGQYSSRFTMDSYSGPSSELGDQMRLNRNQENVNGMVFFSAKSISKNYSGLADSMKNDWYKYPAIPPKMRWKDSEPPNEPKNLNAIVDSISVRLTWDNPELADDGDNAKYYIVYRFTDDEMDMNNPKNIIGIVPGSINRFEDKSIEYISGKCVYSVSSVDKLDNECINKANFVVFFDK